jgi:hypothetical protein
MLFFGAKPTSDPAADSRQSSANAAGWDEACGLGITQQVVSSAWLQRVTPCVLARHGVWRVRKSPTTRIDSARWVGARQSFCTSRLGARRAISALVAAGCGVSEPG